jgi:hypothetical protein
MVSFRSIEFRVLLGVRRMDGDINTTLDPKVWEQGMMEGRCALIAANEFTQGFSSEEIDKLVTPFCRATRA